MNNYNKNQFIASICVALFIINMALVILVLNVNKIIYKGCTEDFSSMAVIPDRGDSETLNTDERLEGNVNGATISGVEARLYYGQLADEFARPGKSEYKLPGYEISSGNADKINSLKSYYIRAWLISVLSFCIGVWNFVILSKRRLFQPFLYGGVLAALFTSLGMLRLMAARNEVIAGLRAMVLHGDYGFFEDGDILRSLLPEAFARYLLFGYIILVLILILFMVFLRWLIIFRGRPHKF